MSCDSLLCGKGRFYMKKYENLALGIVDAAKNEFYQMFCDLRREVETTWL